MKNLFVLLFALLGLVSCLSVPPRYTSTLDDRYKDGVMGISLLGLVPADSASPQGLAVECANNGQGPVTVKWGKSTMTLDADSQAVFLEDQRQLDRSIPAGSRISTVVYPANHVSSAPGAYGLRANVISPLNARQISLAVCVNVNGEDRFYTLKLSQEAPMESTPDGHMSK